MNKVVNKVVICVGIVAILFSSVNYASASAWWGEGARSSQWVTSHGGTVLYFDFKNSKKDSKDLKINLYTASGAVIETERGDRKGKIDDGIAGQSYYLRAKDGDKKVNSEVFSMRRGSTNYATVDMKSKKISLSLGGAPVAPKKKIVAQKPVVQKNNYEEALPKPNIGADGLDYNFLVKPVVKPAPKEIVKEKRAVTIFKPSVLGKFSKNKKDYNLPYRYYKVDYKKIRDDKFEAKVFTLKDSQKDANKKLAQKQ